MRYKHCSINIVAETFKQCKNVKKYNVICHCTVHIFICVQYFIENIVGIILYSNAKILYYNIKICSIFIIHNIHTTMFYIKYLTQMKICTIQWHITLYLLTFLHCLNVSATIFIIQCFVPHCIQWKWDGIQCANELQWTMSYNDIQWYNDLQWTMRYNDIQCTMTYNEKWDTMTYNIQCEMSNNGLQYTMSYNEEWATMTYNDYNESQFISL